MTHIIVGSGHNEWMIDAVSLARTCLYLWRTLLISICYDPQVSVGRSRWIKKLSVVDNVLRFLQPIVVMTSCV